MLAAQGVIQNLSPYLDVTTLEGAKQTIAMGPVASQEAIKELGTNGGGFFNANSAHPFENPTPLTNFIELVLDLRHPGGADLHVRAHGPGPEAGLGHLRAPCRCCSSPAWPWPTTPSRGPTPPWPDCRWIRALGNMEGKEVRFGIANSALFATVTTDASCGAVNSMHDSFTAARAAWCR